MSSLNSKKIILGVTGGIAAYKATLLVRDLVKEGADVRVVMTRSASAFITPLTMQTLSGNPVYHALIESSQAAVMSHIELARWADLVLVAPATADFMARLATGRADDLLTTLCLVTTAPIILAPAMNQQMWLNRATQANAALLTSRDILLWGPGEGQQACGEVGLGRMLEPSMLVQHLQQLMSDGERLQGVRVVITAGPTREAVDPVRFIGNRSSGQMGFALADSLGELGAEVILVSGPVSLKTPQGVDRVDVESALDMQQAVMCRITECDLFVGVAAVADYRPLTVAENKIKKGQSEMTITLQRNPDILADVAALESGPFTVGFAAETEQLEHYAEQKRVAKNIDLIAANNVGAEMGGFECSDNALLLLWCGGKREFPMMPKPQLAKQLAATIAERYHAKNTTQNT
jgi:phosphopantothenoylcysteine decarboxylase/phosphopantothenate--cysteine ligase